MPRLLRPPIPLEIKCRVVLRQLGEMFPDRVIEAWRYDMTVAPTYRAPGFGKLLEAKLAQLAALLGCEPSGMWLDHDPALENRTKVFRQGVHVDYDPPANDPEHLFYRPQAAEAEGSHFIKTYVRGDRGQLSDAGLARKRKKMDRNRAKPKRAPNLTRAGKKGGKLGMGRGIKIRSASRWPAKGSRKLQSKRRHP